MAASTVDENDALGRITSRVRGVLDAWRGGGEPRERPFLTLTYAQSIDGSIAAQRGEFRVQTTDGKGSDNARATDWLTVWCAGVPTLLSGPLSMKMTHALRGMHGGIMIGVGTVIADNPSLNTRLVPGAGPDMRWDQCRQRVLSLTLLLMRRRHEPKADHRRHLAALPDVHQTVHVSCVRQAHHRVRRQARRHRYDAHANCTKLHCLTSSPLSLFDPELHLRREDLEARGATLLPCDGTKDADGRFHVNLRDAFRT